MDLSTQIVPAVVILVANLLSGKYGSFRWKTITAIFGWSAAIAFVAFLVVRLFVHDNAASGYLLQIFSFCLLTALSRDYERLLRPLFPRNR